MLVRSKPSWELPERIVTPERLVMNRRGLLQTAGMLAAASALAGCDRGRIAKKPQAQQAAANQPDPTASLYPAKRNEAFQAGPGREITREEIVAGYNNYYEFGV